MPKRFLVLPIAGMVILPLLPLILWSLTERWYFPALLPQQFGLRSWSYILQTASGQVLDGLYTSLTVGGLTTFFALILGVPCGKILGRTAFTGKKLVALLLLLPVIVPPLSVSMGLHYWFLKLRLAETLLGVVLVHLTFCLPYAVFTLWGVFADFDPEYEEQARSLGASPLQVLMRVTVPMILPGLCVAGLFSFLLSWSQYLSTLIIGGGKLMTLPLLLFSLMDSGDRPVAAAVSLIFIAPTFVALLVTTHFTGQKGVKKLR